MYIEKRMQNMVRIGAIYVGFKAKLLEHTLQKKELDSKTDIPIEYASVSLLGKDNDIITGTVSDKDGEFLFRELPSGTYSIKIEFIIFTI